MSHDLAVLVLAAGKGTRMRSQRAKVLHQLAGLPLVAHGLYTCQALHPQRITVVIGHQAEQVQAALDQEFGKGTLRYALQTQQLGTAHAVMAARTQLEGGPKELYILAGDVPLLTARTLEQMRSLKHERRAAICTLSFLTDDTTGYGRILRDANGNVIAIREDRDCSPEEKLIKECNSAIYLVDTEILLQCLDQIDDQNDQGEFYLTDIVELSIKQGRRVAGLIVDDPVEIMGVNDRAQLAELERRWIEQRTTQLMQSGVSFQLPHTTWIDFHVQIEPDCVIGPHCCLKGRTHLKQGAQIGAYCYLEDATIDANSVLPPRSTLKPAPTER